MSAKRMYDLVARYGTPPGYINKILLDGQDMFILGPLEIGVCEGGAFERVFTFPCILLSKNSLVGMG